MQQRTWLLGGLPPRQSTPDVPAGGENTGLDEGPQPSTDAVVMHNWQLQKAPNPTSLEDKPAQEVPVPHEQMAVVSWPMQHPELDAYEQVVSLV